MMVLSMLSAPRVDAALNSKPLPAGSWWTNAGTFSYELSGTGAYNGEARFEGTYTVKYEVVSSDESTMVIRYSETEPWTCTSTGEWTTACQPSEGTYSYQTDYTIDVATLKVTATHDAPPTETSTQKEVGHPTWILLATDLSVGDTATQWWKVPNSDSTSSTITDVLYKVEKLQEINIKGIDVTVRVLTYTGEHLGGFYRGGLHSKGPRTESDLYDTVYGIYMGHTTSGTYTYSDSQGSWTETYVDTSQITDTNLEFKPPQVSITLGRPTANVPVTVDDVSYSGDQLPKVFTWEAGSTHTLQVDKMVQGDLGVRYMFIEWSDGSKDASRSITATESGNLTATFKTQYELKATSDFGDPQGGGWYDAESTATFSVTSPQPETGLFGSLGGKKIFQEWSGDSTADTSMAEIVMDGPKTVQAQWTTDDTQPYIILGGIAVAVVAVVVVILMLMRRRSPMQVEPAARLKAQPSPVVPAPARRVTRSSRGKEMKYCIHCGATIAPTATFCAECGKKQK